MTPVERILAAVELNPNRDRVTLRRADARFMLEQHQRKDADNHYLTTSLVRAGEMLSQRSSAIDQQALDIAEISADRDRAAQAAKHWREKTSEARTTMFDFAWVWPRALLLYGAAAVGGVLVGHG